MYLGVVGVGSNRVWELAKRRSTNSVIVSINCRTQNTRHVIVQSILVTVEAS